MSGSDADGCGYILVRGTNGMENIAGRIEMAEEEMAQIAESLQHSSLWYTAWLPNKPMSSLI